MCVFFFKTSLIIAKLETTEVYLVEEIHTMEQHSAMKSNGLPMRAPTWINLQRIILSEKEKQSEKMTHYIIQFM